MSQYHDSADLKLMPELKKLAPREFEGFVALDSIVGKEDGAIPRKYEELHRNRGGLHDPVPVLPRCARPRCEARRRDA